VKIYIKYMIAGNVDDLFQCFSADVSLKLSHNLT